MKAFLTEVVDIRDSSYLMSIYWSHRKDLVY